MNTCAIVITSYKSRKTIIQTINSLKSQTLPTGWNINFYIGVDACQDTANVLANNNIPYYWSDTNVGTYILSNSLLYKAKEDNCDIFVRFDADDVACENFLKYGIEHTEKNNVSNTTFIPCDNNLNILPNRKHKMSHGSIFISKLILDQLGGYHHYRVSCDKYLNLRIKKLGYKGKSKKSPTYLYRESATSLSRSFNTGIKTNYRTEIEKKLEESLNKETFIDPVTIKLTYISNTRT